MSSRPALLISFLLVLQSAVSSADAVISGAVAVGYEHDSNVAVEELDRSSGLGDSGLVSSFELDLDTDISETVNLVSSYSYSRIDYDTFDLLNRETHTFGLNLNIDFGSVNSATSYFYIQARLDGKDFLNYQRLSPALSGFISKRWFLRGAYVYAEKDVSSRPGRNATNNGAELDAYFFWQGLRRYINAGYQFRAENSEAARFDYHARQAKLRFVQRITLLERLSTLELGIRYEDRDYKEATPSIAKRRRDNRFRFKIEFEVPLTKSISWTAYSGYSDYQSNLPTADYEQTLIGTRIEWTF